VRRVLLGLVIAATAAAGCSQSSDRAEPPATTSAVTSTSTSTSTTVPASAAELHRRACEAYDAFWNVDYSGGEPSPTMLARERDLVTAAQATRDRSLHDAIRGVIEGELGLPRFYIRATAEQLQAQASELPIDARQALQQVLRNDRIVRSKCDTEPAPSGTAG
jgi:hypothetical protein